MTDTANIPGKMNVQLRSVDIKKKPVPEMPLIAVIAAIFAHSSEAASYDLTESKAWRSN